MECYKINVDGELIEVSEYAVKVFFGELVSSESTNEQRAMLIAERKSLAKKCRINADIPFYAGLLFGGDLNPGECLYFKFGYDLTWNVSIKRLEDGQYALYASNQKNLFVHDKTFSTKQQAILFCANRFNEDAIIHDSYPDAQALCEEYARKFEHQASEETLAKQIEHSVNSYNFDYKKFAECIRAMHPTLQQNFFRLIKASIIFMGDEKSHFIDPRNKASHDICKDLSAFLQDNYIPHI
ncbi:MAG: hypothetical protein LUD40_12430 [Phocaeicola dorei]|nr:hypothetical protein [Phocaeicola dorei]